MQRTEIKTEKRGRLAHGVVELHGADSVWKYRVNKKLVPQFSGHTKFEDTIMIPALHP
jgi:hypothetical protein